MVNPVRVRFSFLLAFFIAIPVISQSRLPDCETDSRFKHNCTGVASYPDMRYEGEFQNDRPNGQGTGLFQNGAKYVGEFKEGQRAGLGRQTFADGTIYSGSFKDGLFNGHGSGLLPDGARYIGEYRDGKRNGKGVWTHPDGRKYVGEWRDHKRNGDGIEYRADGAIQRSGYWTDGNLSRTFALERSQFPFGGYPRVAEASAATGRADQARLATEAEAGRYKQQALEMPQTLPQKQVISRPAVSSGGARQERRVALVIGNANYKVGKLENPLNDAIDMSSVLRGLGFEVTLLQDATLMQMRNATRKFEDVVLDADVALIFFAGHGVEAKGRNYVIPVNADIQRDYELDDQAYNAGQWLEMLEVAQSKNTQRVNIVILDACRDNPVSRQWRSVRSGFGQMNAPRGSLLVYSTSPGKVASDGPKGQRNSPFTKSLLRSMQLPNLPVEQVLKEVRRQVLVDTNGEQVPWENSSLVGDFVFKRQQ